MTKALLFLGTGTLTDRFESSAFAVLAGRGAHAGVIKATLLLGLLSLIGLPPAIGFLGKLSILSAGIRARAWPWVAAVGVGSILTLLYAGRAYQVLFWDVSPSEHGPPARLNVSKLGCAGIGLLLTLILSVGLYGRPVWKMSLAAARATLSMQAASKPEDAP